MVEDSCQMVTKTFLFIYHLLISISKTL